MLRSRHIAFITGNYPSAAFPDCGTFVRQLVVALRDSGHRCDVIHPLKFHDRWRERRACHRVPESDQGIRVHRPLWLSCGNVRLGGYNSFALTHAFFRRAVWRCLRRLPEPPDVTYGHFLYSAGEAAVWAGRRLGRPRFTAVGEGTFWTLEPLGETRARRDFRDVTGLIAVSRRLRQMLVERLGIPEHRIRVLPNGVDPRRFYPRDKVEMRRKFGLPLEAFLTIYVGTFIESKGVLRVAAAIGGLANVGGVFLGSGPSVPQAANVVFCRRVAHAEVPELLSAADCFVLPSDVEGSSNATLEAMACGLPVIVSDGDYNDDIVNDEVGLRVPWNDVGAIRSAVVRLRDNPALLTRLARNAAVHVRDFDVGARAQRLSAWMEQLSVSVSPV